jgi:hypothetical protein
MATGLIKLKKYADMWKGLNEIFGDGFEAFRSELLNAAERELYPMGVQTLFVLAVSTETADLKGIQNPFGRVLMASAESVFDAIVDGDATQVKEVWEKTWDTLRAESDPPTPAEATMSYKLFEAMHVVGDLMHSAAKEAGYDTSERRDDDVNPFYNQMEQGMIVEFYYGLPSKIYTPLGEYHITGSSGGTREESERYLDLFFHNSNVEFELLSPERNTNQGTFGPWYTVRRVKGMKLPDPVKRDRKSFVEYEDSKAAWEKLTRQYLALHCRRDKYIVTVKYYPDSDAAKPLAEQQVMVADFYPDGTVSVFPSDTFATHGGVAIRIPLTDLNVFEGNKVR